jgi:hypothetical protein
MRASRSFRLQRNVFGPGLRVRRGARRSPARSCSPRPPRTRRGRGRDAELHVRHGRAGQCHGPQRLPGPVGGLLFDGAVWSRFPQKNIQPFNIQLPHARAGCGGIDLFAGSFSFINTAELVAMLKATANNALGFAFKLAIDTISPEIGKVMDELAQKVQQMNQMNISSCETAQALVGGLWPTSDTASSVICEAIANSQGAVADWARRASNATMAASARP